MGSDDNGANKGVGAIERWLADAIVRHLKVPPSQVNPNEPFTRFGADSLTLVTIGGDLEEWLDITIPPSMMWQYPTIASLARALVEGPDAVDTDAEILESDTVDLEDLTDEELKALLDDDG